MWILNQPYLIKADIIIWVQRGNKKASKIINSAPERLISAQSYMELLQCANNKSQHKLIKAFLINLNFTTIPFTQNIGHRACVYAEEYTLSHGIQAGDAVIAATAVEYNQTLVSGNGKHFKPIKDLSFKAFKH